MNAGPAQRRSFRLGTAERVRLVALGAAAGAAVMAATATGDVLLVGVLLGLAAADVAAGTIGVLVGIATIARWGSSSLAALAGGQAVLGAAGWSGPPGMVLSSWAAAAAVILACPQGIGRPDLPGRWAPPAASGLVAALLVAGPAVGAGGSAGSLVLRVVASAAAIAAASVVARRLPRPVARSAGLAVAVVAVVLALWP